MRAVEPGGAVYLGYWGADAGAGAAPGAVGIMVPTPVTRKAEVEAAPRRAATLPGAVEQVLAGEW